MTIDIKTAVNIAKENLAVVFESEEPRSIRLEEVILDDYNNWIITLSYTRNNLQSAESTALAILGASLSNKRYFKVVTISKDSGDVKSIKIRSDD
ncbi:hypothetical protein [Acinetobacter baumannii]|uniref:hypothetical protein n=1 Tax=Acinetobacter baumannii TaxID=470 RepID=UPI001C0D3698|nr:hypothetical protein [Acinetobacter baumannii]MBU3817711.1 hypothetical protein [Acinetobacter baumannii]MDC4850717.1 hypothetical protein [Acinetobacter baumannii]MDC4973721.1 hypothetical protein [Acinetobacter baumannii]MDC5093621.1 hypothetical protein [Acinetobacter baumannii]MDC5557560.1 hypothetical protein [Acinetobacter baumannii]